MLELWQQPTADDRKQTNTTDAKQHVATYLQLLLLLDLFLRVTHANRHTERLQNNHHGLELTQLPVVRTDTRQPLWVRTDTRQPLWVRTDTRQPLWVRADTRQLLWVRTDTRQPLWVRIDTRQPRLVRTDTRQLLWVKTVTRQLPWVRTDTITRQPQPPWAVSYTHLRAHETRE